MKIFEALDIQAQEKKMISLVGGGGKTTTMYRLAKELKTNGKRVLVTTTTHIYYPDKTLYDRFLWWEDVQKIVIDKADLRPASITVVGSRMVDGMKLKGINKEDVDELFGREIFDVILVEADGAKGKPIKAPAEQEPVIPGHTSLLIGVIGIDCYGEEIGPLRVHRPQLLSKVTDRGEGSLIDDEVIEKLVLSPEGLFKGCPEKGEKVLFINKVENSETVGIAKRIGTSVLKQSPDIKKVLIGSIIGIEPIQYMLQK